MGIPSYFSHIVKNYADIIRNLGFIRMNISKLNHLYMDCNSIVYDCFNSLKDECVTDIDHFERKIIDSTIQKIAFYITLISPNKTVFIAFDGVAPLAKMEQQRKRRYKNTNSTSTGWSTSNITPGTQFMKKLSEELKLSFSAVKCEAKIIISSSDECGEGEHKLFKYIRTQPIDPEDSALVYGLDSDLIMLSIFHCKYFKHLFIFREAPEFGRVVESKDSKEEYYFMDIHSLSNSILTEMQCGVPDKNRVYDYVLFCFLLGNDFLPHFPSLNIRTNGVQILMDTYRKYIGNYSNRFLSFHGKIQWKWLLLFISELAKVEHENIKREYFLRSKNENRVWKVDTDLNKDQTLQSVPIIYRSEELYICPSEVGWEERYYKSLFGVDTVLDVCKNYTEGLNWVFEYYTNDCIDWRWKFDHHYPPLLKDLRNYIDKLNLTPDNDLVLKKPPNPLTAKVQLAYVLPRHSHTIMKPKNSDILNEKYSHLYPKSYDFQWAFCRYLWESHVILPRIENDILDKWEFELI